MTLLHLVSVLLISLVNDGFVLAVCLLVECMNLCVIVSLLLIPLCQEWICFCFKIILPALLPVTLWVYNLTIFSAVSSVTFVWYFHPILS
jgi:uncharacterized membrane protein